jgi:hypothetical protein
MRPIPIPMRATMSEDPFYSKCCVVGLGYCAGKVQWHHVWIYAGKQINEIWAILPGCERHHDQVQKEPEVRKFFEKVSLSRAGPEDLAKYPKKDWEQIKCQLSLPQKE